MKTVIAPFINLHCSEINFHEVTSALGKLSPNPIDYFPWDVYKTDSSVFFTIATSLQHILIRFSVKERHIRAANTVINSPVYEDSCVEFFISFDDSGYYNFEFNCIGNILAEFGKSKKERNFLPVAALEKIKREVIINHSEDGYYEWNLTVVIPFEVLIHHSIQDIRGHEYRANFYKCGDKLPHPHYITWSPITSPAPDFHQPQYFGKIVF